MVGKIKKLLVQLYRDILVNSIAASYFTPIPIRKLIYNFYGINTKTKSIRPKCYFGGRNVTIGKGTTINGRCYFENLEGIEIGEYCDIAMDVLFCTSTHEFGSKEKRAGKAYGKAIKVGNGCWIGARVTILPGVTIGDGCIIAAGAVVTKDCEANGLYIGFPANKVRDLER
ncbi:acyltransferase [Planococcus sp. APC 3900]|uniref:acyltransferase n=1 Tax=Planococcus sp. APC 3900 TaxID=3035191 RepID=UPI0025B2FC54|nr:acyltransferase [Planococcus sp. APC 3900]MDN3437279.1 acyltransferase [Planococcus sp. APC 3900]